MIKHNTGDFTTRSLALDRMNAALTFGTISILAVLSWPAQAWSQESAITVNVRAEQLEYRTFPADQNIPLVVLLCGETALGACQSLFTVRCELTCSRRISPTGLFVRITRVKVTSDLLVTIWTRDGSSPDVMAHEETHRAIAKHYYGLMEEVARRLARPYLRRKVPLSLTRNPEEDLRIVDEWQTELAEAILRETQDRANFANKILDTLTHGRPPDALAAATKAAFAEEAADYAARARTDAKKP